MSTIMLIIASIIVVSLVSIVGIFFLFLKEQVLKSTISALLALAVGALLGGAMFHLLPEVFSINTKQYVISWFVLLGIFTFFALEKFLHWHHSHQTHSINENICVSCKENIKDKPKPLGKMVIFSDMLHNALDGAVIASAFLISPTSGIAATFAVLLHEIPQEVADFGVLLHAGYSKSKAIIFNFLSALTAFLGAGLVLFANELAEKSIEFLSAFAAGSLLYIAMSDLIPELHKKHNFSEVALQIIMISIGLISMFTLTLLD